GDDELVARSAAAVQRILDTIGRPIAEHVTRWPEAIPQYRPGHGRAVERMERLAGEKRVVLAGSAFHGISVNECIAGARRVVDKVAALVGAAALAVVLGCSGSSPSPSDPGDAGRGGKEA